MKNIKETPEREQELIRHIAALKSANSGERYAAARILGGLADPRAIEPLIAALQDEDKFVRREAAAALGKLEDARAVKPLIAAFKDKSYDVRLSAADALGKLGKIAVAPLLAALKEEDEKVRGMAANALGTLGDGRAVEPLLVALQDEHRYVRCSAAKALGVIEDACAVEPLLAALEDKDFFVRKDAADALKRIRTAPLEDPRKEMENHGIPRSEMMDEIGPPRRTKTGGSPYRYQGISLSAYECSIMKILEQLVDQSIPHTAELDHDFLGFVANYSNVIELSLSRAYEKQEIPPLELPRDFGGLKRLEKLTLFDNELCALPESFKDLANLKKLDLAVNCFQTLPEFLGQLTSLQKLSLSRNELTALPESLGNLINLEVLDLRNNKLTSLPESFKNLIHLKKLDLDNSVSLQNIPRQLEESPRSTGRYVSFRASSRKAEIVVESGFWTRILCINNQEYVFLRCYPNPGIPFTLTFRGETSIKESSKSLRDPNDPHFCGRWAVYQNTGKDCQ